MGLTAHRVGADEQPGCDRPEGIDADLTVVVAIVDDLSNAIFENDGTKGERHTVLRQVGRVLLEVVLDVQAGVYGLAV